MRTFLLRSERTTCAPLTNPRAPSIIAKRKKPPLRHKHVNLRPARRCFCQPKVIVDNEPAGIAEQDTVTIKVTTHIVVRVAVKKPDIARTKASKNFLHGSIFNRYTVN